MRALLLAALLLVLPTLAGVSAGPSEARFPDLIVTTRAPIDDAPAGALALSVFPGFVLRDATPADAARLAADPRVERVDWARPLAFAAADARLPTHAFTQLTRADATGLDGRGVTLAVLDSGIDAAHPDLVGRVRSNVRLTEGSFLPAPGDPDGHGTHVAGVIAASGASSNGRWTGVAPAAELVGIDISTRFTTAGAVLAYDWLLSNRDELGVDVVVNAWGRVGEGERFDARDPVMRAIDRLVAEGVVVVFSASNHGPAAGTLSMEAMHPRVISVGATDAAGVLMDYSSRGPIAADRAWTKPDVVAPGDAVVGPRSGQSLPRDVDPDPLHTVYSGTSQAAPHVAGIVAMMLEVRSAMSPEEVADALRASAIDLGAPGPDDASGYGLVDATDALRVARGLAPTRTNVLVAGGTERYRDETDLAATGRRGILDLMSRTDVVWETPFAVKPGTQRLRAEAQAPGAQAVEVELIHDGLVFPAREVESPEPGIWTLRLRAALPIATSASALIETELPPQPARALEYDGRAARPGPPPAGLDSGYLAAWGAGAVAVAALSGIALAAAVFGRRGEK